MAIYSTEITTGYISRSEISKRFRLSETSISKYQNTFDDFPVSEIQSVSFCAKPIQIFKDYEIDGWFKTHRKALGIKLGFDLYLSRQFITGQFSHRTIGCNQ